MSFVQQALRSVPFFIYLVTCPPDIRAQTLSTLPGESTSPASLPDAWGTLTLVFSPGSTRDNRSVIPTGSDVGSAGAGTLIWNPNAINFVIQNVACDWQQFPAAAVRFKVRISTLRTYPADVGLTHGVCVWADGRYVALKGPASSTLSAATVGSTGELSFSALVRNPEDYLIWVSATVCPGGFVSHCIKFRPGASPEIETMY